MGVAGVETHVGALEDTGIPDEHLGTLVEDDLAADNHDHLRNVPEPRHLLACADQQRNLLQHASPIFCGIAVLDFAV